MSAIPQSRQAILTALYRDTAFVRQPYRGTPIVYRYIGRAGYAVISLLSHQVGIVWPKNLTAVFAMRISCMATSFVTYSLGKPEHPKTRATIQLLRYTVFWRNQFLNDGAP